MPIAPTGTEILVNTATSGNQLNQRMVVLSDGSFVVVWTDQSMGVGGAQGDTQDTAIKAQRYSAEGLPLGDEILVNTAVEWGQYQPEIVALSNGGFAISWQDGSNGVGGAGGDMSNLAIKAQAFDAAGDRVGGEVLVNSTTLGTQSEQQMAALAGGGFVVTWRSQDVDTGDIHAQILDASGVPVGGEIPVNTISAATQQTPHITALTGGGFVITWNDASQSPDDLTGAVRAQVFDASGAMVGTEFRVHTTTAGDQFIFGEASEDTPHSPITALADGGFVIAWSDMSGSGGDMSAFGARLQQYDAAGAPVGGERVVNTTTIGSQLYPSVTALVDGGYVVTWRGPDGDQDGAFAQVFDAAGEPVGGEILVNTTTAGPQWHISATALSGGGFLVAWSDYGGDADGWAVKTQEFGADGSRVGDEVLVNTTTAGDQFFPVIVALADGGAAISWVDWSMSPEIRMQVFTGAVNAIPVASDASASVEEDGILEGAVSATDADVGAVLTYALTDVAPAGLTFNEDGTYSFDASDYDYLAEGETAVIEVSYTATDENDETSEPATLTITVTGTNDVPVASSSSISVDEDDAVFNGSVSATDADDGAVLTYQLVEAAPPGLTFNSDGSYSFDASVYSNLSEGEAFWYDIEFTATDAEGGVSATQILTITVTGSNDAPVVTAATGATGEGRATSGSVPAATDIDDGSSIVSYQLTDEAPAGLVFNSDGTWTFDGSGFDGLAQGESDTLVVNYTATDEDGLTSEPQTLTITVTGIAGTSGNDTIYGTSGNDVLEGGAGSDNIYGGEGDDIFIGNADGVGDAYRGQGGSDTVDYSGAISAMNINLNNAASGGGVGTDQLYSIENVIASDFNDTISGTSGANRIEGGLGDDTINGNGGVDTVVINADAVSGMAVQGSFNLTVTSADGVDVLRNVEFIQFDNALIQINGVTGNAHAYGVADADTATEDGAASTGNVLTNDIEIEGEAMSVSSAGVIVGAHGTLTILADGSYSYVATNQALAEGEVVSDVFNYTVVDSAGEGSTASLSFTVTGTNDDPVAEAGSNSVDEDGLISGSVAATDVDGDVLTYALAGEPVMGLTFNADGSYDFDASSYELNEGETQDVTFSYTVSDGNGGTDTASVTITVNGINDAPVANASSNSVGEDDLINGSVSANDVDGTVTSYELVGDAPEGLIFNADGTYSFDASGYDALAEGETLDVTATFTATDDQGVVSEPQTLTITITGSNDAPEVSGTDFSIDEDDSVSGSVSGTDVDGTVVSYALVGEGPTGLTFNADGSYDFDASSYELNAGETAEVSFTFTGTDDSGGVSDPRTVTITVNGINDAPVANAASNSVGEDDAINGAVSADDVDGTVVSYQLVGDAPEGLIFNADGTYSFDASSYDAVAEGETLDVTATFTATDDQGVVSEPQTLTITITGSNDAPEVSGADFSIDEDDSVSGSVSGTDVDGTVVSYTLVGEGPAGLTFNADGTYIFDASSYDSLNAGDSQEVSFTFTGTDDSGGVSDPRTITITVNGVNDAPVATAASNSLNEDDAINGSVSASDEDGTVVSYQLVGDAPEGLIFNADGTYSFDASNYDALAEGETLDVTATFTATDDQGIVSEPQTLTITITGSNDAPEVSGADFSIDEDDSVSGSVSGTDVDGTVVSYALVGEGPTGLTFNADGSYDFDASSYELAAGDSQEVSFTFTGTDDSGGVSDPRSVTITINGVNDAPVAAASSNSVNEDDLINGSVSASDVDSVVASYQLVGEVPVGLTMGTDGTYSFDASSYDDLAAGETRDVTATFTATDEEGAESAPQTLTITINGVNDAPVVQPSSGGVTEDVDVTPPSMGGVYAEVEGNNSFGTANVVNREDFRIGDNPDLGDDSLPSILLTGSSNFEQDYFAITLVAGETLIVDADYVAPGGDVHVGLYSPGGAYIIDAGHNGSGVGGGGAGGGEEGYFSYVVPTSGTYYVYAFNYSSGSYGLNVSIADFVGVVGSDSATSTLNDSGTVDFVDVDLTDEHTVGATADGMGYLGTFEVELGDASTGDGAGAVNWTFSVDNDAVQHLAEGETLTQTYTVTVDDGNGGTGEQTVTITITGSNDAPVAVSATNSLNEDDTINGSVSASDIDGDPLSYQLVGDAPEGLVLNVDGTYSFDASSYDELAEGETLDVTAAFTATDDQGGVSAEQTLTITITGSNDAPEAEDDAVSVGDGDLYEGQVSASDVDGVVVSYQLTGLQPDGLTFNADGSYSFDASAFSLNLGETEEVSFTFTATDDEGSTSEERTVIITVIGQPTQVALNDGGDSFTGTNDDEDITGGDGDDVIFAGGGTNTVDGGAGDDTITAGSGDDTLLGGDGDDTITGGSGNDVLDGGEGDDNVNGGSGDDLVYSSTGDDYLRGGSGNDTISFQNTAAGVAFSLAATGLQRTVDGNDLYQGFENVIGTAFNDTLTGDDQANRLEGGDGNDTLNGGLGDDILIGGAGNDTYFVDAGDTVIEEADGGIDRIFTSAASFTLGGNVENIYGQSAAGHTFTGDDGANTMVGNSGDDVLIGGLGADTLIGQAGNDTLSGGTGAANTLIGGLGDDTYIVEANDTIVELAGQGHDTLLTTHNSYTLNANIEDMGFIGAGDFIGVGNVLDNVLTGGDGNDTLTGGAGNDTLDGGDGIDVARVSGQSSGYSVTREGDGWRVIDTFLGDGDTGSDFLMNIETLMFGNGETLSLVIEDEPAIVFSGKGEFDEAQVLPGLADDDFVFSKFDDVPLVLPGSDGFGEALFGALGSMQPAIEDTLLVRDGFMAELLPDANAPSGNIDRHDDWMM